MKCKQSIWVFYYTGCQENSISCIIPYVSSKSFTFCTFYPAALYVDISSNITALKYSPEISIFKTHTSKRLSFPLQSMDGTNLDASHLQPKKKRVSAPLKQTHLNSTLEEWSPICH